MGEIGEAAEYYARELGFAVFPLLPRSKRPAVANGVKDATTDAGVIAGGWAQNPSMNVAVACGEPSGGLLVIDIDVDGDTGEDGMEFLAKWEREHGELPETVSAITGRGGSHLYYRVSGRMKNSANPDVGVDIRCDGGYVMAPPSIHPNGRAVQWENDPRDYEVAEADENVLAFVEAVRPSGFGGRGRKVDPTKVVKKGGRNNALFKALASARSAGADDDVLEAYALAYNKTKLDPPLPADEVRRTLESVLAYEPGNKEAEANAERAGTARSNPAFRHNVCARRLIEEQGACFVDGMPAIVRDGRYRIGWGEIDKAIIEMRDDVTQQKRKETKLYLDAKAPRVSASPPELIGFENGVLNVLTMEFRPWRSTDIIPNVVPHRWDPFAECPIVDESLRKFASGDPGAELNLREAAGLCMYRSPKFGYAPVLLGDGSNGKSTYIAMLRALLGNENVSSLDLATIGKNFMAQHVAGKLANIGDDISNEFLKGDTLATFKKIATGSRIFSDVKNGVGFEFDPYCTLMFSANEFPRLGDSGYGVMRRLFPIRFNATFRRDDPDYDPDIVEKLTSEEASMRFAVIAVHGLRRVLERGEMTPNRESERSKGEIERDNDPVLLWVDEAGIERADLVGRVNSDAYRDFSEWCRSNGAMPVKITKFSRTVCGTLGLKSVPETVETVGKGKKKMRVYR